MKIILKNFRCYENKTFDFGKTGIILLSGPSGIGKTSILSGIYFALFGTGTKIVSYGKTSCSVTLEFDGMTITRTKRPNRLVVNDVYEDDAAQNIINEKFGDMFQTTGYISQNAKESFILMSPIEKLGFLEKFAFNDVNLTQIKKRCKDLIKERYEELNKTTSQLEMATLMVNELEEPKEVFFPLKCSVNNREKAIKNEIIRYKNSKTLIKRCEKKMDTLKKELTELQVYDAKIKSKQDSLNNVSEKIINLNLEKENINYEGDEKVEKYEKDLTIIISQRELISLENRHEEDQKTLENMKHKELDDISINIEDIKLNLWKEYTKDEINTTITEYKQIIKDLEKVNEEKSKLERYKVDEDILKHDIKQLELNKNTLDEKKRILDKLEIQQEIFECPSCQTELRFHDDELHILENSISTDIHEQEDIDNVTEEISKLKRTISGLESSISSRQSKLERYTEIKLIINNIECQYEELPDLLEIKNDLEYINSYNSSQKELEKQLCKLVDQIDGKKYSSTIVSFEESVKKQKKNIEHLRKKVYKEGSNEKIDEEKLRENIIKQKRNKEKLKTINSDIKSLMEEQSEYQRHTTKYKNIHLQKYKSIREIDVVQENIDKCSGELDELEKKSSLYEQNVKNIEKYQEYEKSRNIYISWLDKVNILKKEEIENRRQYGAATLLNEKILESESIAMLNIISSINSHTQVYLDSFFPDNPISVKLIPFKETKKGEVIKKKPQINLEIEYKGMEADINMLSGGELSRVILSFALALGEMFNTPMMMLDECTSSLDQELTGTVMDGIRENFNGKLVLIIAHQVVKGQFDKVINIGVD